MVSHALNSEAANRDALDWSELLGNIGDRFFNLFVDWLLTKLCNGKYTVAAKHTNAQHLCHLCCSVDDTALL